MGAVHWLNGWVRRPAQHPLIEQRSSKAEREWSQYNMIHICSISVKKCAFLGGAGRWEL